MDDKGFEIAESGPAVVDPLIWGRSGNLFHLAKTKDLDLWWMIDDNHWMVR